MRQTERHRTQGDGWVGFVTGGLFGILLSFAENRKAERRVLKQPMRVRDASSRSSGYQLVMLSVRRHDGDTERQLLMKAT